jgi:hypothetical protein
MKTLSQKLTGLILFSVLLNYGTIMAQPNVVTINSGGNLELNGTPFFMNAIYSNVQCSDYTTTADLERIKAAGINTILTYHQLEKVPYDAYEVAYLDRAQAAGLKVIIDFSTYTSDGNFDLIEAAVKQFKDHPALLGWYAFDEFWDTTKTEQTYSTIKALDKNHPVWGVLCCFDSSPYKGFKKSADIMGFDLYPVGVGNQDDQEYKQSLNYQWSTWIAAEYTPPSHTIMSVSQIFNQETYSDYDGYTREPTLQEKRLAAYLMLVGGNKGNFFYSYYDILTRYRDCVAWPASVVDNNLAEMKIYGQEIGDVGRLAILNGTEFNRQEQGDIDFLKTIGYEQSSGEVYVLAANISMSNSQSVTVDIPLTSWTNEDISVLYGNITAEKVGSRLQITTPGGESGTIRIRKSSSNNTDLIDNEVYELAPSHAQDMRLDVSGDNNSNGTNVEIWQANGGNNQKWKLLSNGNNYELAPLHATDMRLDVNGANNSNGTNVQIWQANGGSAQQWQLEKVSDGVYELAPLCATDKRLDVAEAGTNDGSNVLIYEDGNGDNQRWLLKKVGANKSLSTDGFNNRQSFSVFPNPSNGNFSITYDNLEKDNYTIEVTNLLGQNVYQENLTNFSGNMNKQLSLPNKEKGVYVITLTNSNNNKISKKLVVN